MITIYTHNPKPTSLEFWRYFVSRYILGRRRGPDSVKESLIRGLYEAGVSFSLDVPKPSGNVIVLSGISALEENIEAKKNGVIKKLIAGPNIVVDPRDSGGIICHDAIDIVLTPSNWTAAYWRASAPEIADKIRVWAAGISIHQPSDKTGSVIIYDKILDESLVEKIKLEVEKHSGKPALIFTYGSFQRKDYLKALETAPAMIYLSRSESQGLALFEAWSYDVPTIVNLSEIWQSEDHIWKAPLINAPYLNDELGLVFQDTRDIPDLLEVAKDLRPKVFCDKNFSDAISARKLLELL